VQVKRLIDEKETVKTELISMRKQVLRVKDDLEAQERRVKEFQTREKIAKEET
jgi:hypothetical protein